MKKDKHIGDTYVSKQGFTLCVRKWVNRERIQVEVAETGEKIWTDYWSLRRGDVTPNLYKYPPKGECHIKTAIFFTIGISSLILAAVGGLIYWICS